MLYGDGLLLVPFTLLPYFGHNMYTLEVASPQHKAHTITYDIMYKQLGHPSKDVLKYACDHTCNFPSFIEFPKEDTICPGYIKGKMLACAYHPDSCHASKPFELIHLDIKSFPILSYHKYWYIITFFDDFTSYGWSIMLHTKSATLQAAKHFLSMVSTQFDTKVKGWMFNAGGEYRSEAFDKILANNRITAYQSAPHIHQQNGCTEHFMQTIMVKLKLMCLQACILKSYWEFFWTHAVHVYNRTPLWCHDWQTSYEKLNQQSPDIRHLCIFGCRAYIHLSADVHTNKMASKLEVIVYLGIGPDNDKNFLFMHCSNNIKFISSQALFDEQLFPFCDKPMCMHTKAPPIGDNEDDLNIPALDGHNDDLPPTTAPPLNPPQPPHPYMPEYAACPLSSSRRPHKAASECHLPVGISAVPPAPLCHFGHECYMPHQPGSVHDDDHYPVNQLKDIERDEASSPSGSRIPGSFPDAMPPDISVPDITAANLSKDEIGASPGKGEAH